MGIYPDTDSGFSALAEGLKPSEVVLVTGISGSGKSVAMHALEDAGYFCVDNLPPELLPEFLKLESKRETRHVAISMDARSASSLPQLLPMLKGLRAQGVHVLSIFLDASTDALVHRFSETRRSHPLSKLEVDSGDVRHILIDSIDMERKLLAGIRAESTVLDTSELRPTQLRSWVRNLVDVQGTTLTLVFESFAFKHGVPLDADFVFDVRVLPNPYYVHELRPLTGRDAPVAAYLDRQPEVAEMLAQIGGFLEHWLPSFEADHRSYLTVALGCTGGQHRSVYMVEQLARKFASHGATLTRHRELDVG